MCLNELPDYLRMHVDAAPNKEQVSVCGDIRFTVITPQLIRIDQQKIHTQMRLMSP